jgi:branched-chain amino acid transport system permease protein
MQLVNAWTIFAVGMELCPSKKTHGRKSPSFRTDSPSFAKAKMMFDDPYVLALCSGILLGGFYTVVSLGLSVAFGLLGVPYVAHPAMLVVGAYGAFVLNGYGMDPLLAGLVLAPVFMIIGASFYRFYHAVFERRVMKASVGEEGNLRAIAFFVGLAFVIEVGLLVAFGVDQRLVSASYIGRSIAVGDMRIPLRLLVAFVVAISLTGLLALFMSKTYLGRAINAVAQDSYAMELVGADPTKIKTLAFGIALAITAIAGALLIIVGPVEPGNGRILLGKVFSIVVLGGSGSIGGTLPAAMILGIAESMVLASPDPSWAPAVSFAVLLIVLAVRPSGLFGARI